VGITLEPTLLSTSITTGLSAPDPDLIVHGNPLPAAVTAVQNLWFTASIEWEEGGRPGEDGIDETNKVFKSGKTNPQVVAKIILTPNVGYYFDTTQFAVNGSHFTNIIVPAGTSNNLTAKSLVNGEPGTLVLALTYMVLEKDITLTDAADEDNYVGRIPRPIHGNSVNASAFKAADEAPFTATVEWAGEAKITGRFDAADYANTKAVITIVAKDGYKFPSGLVGFSADEVLKAVAVDATTTGLTLTNLDKVTFTAEYVSSGFPLIYNRVPLTALNAIPLPNLIVPRGGKQIAFSATSAIPATEIASITGTATGGATDYAYNIPQTVRITLHPAERGTSIPGYTFSADTGSAPYFTRDHLLQYFVRAYDKEILGIDFDTALEADKTTWYTDHLDDFLTFNDDQFRIAPNGDLIFELTYKKVSEEAIVDGDILTSTVGNLNTKPAANGVIPNGLTIPASPSTKFDVGSLNWTDKNGDTVEANGTNKFPAVGSLPYTATFILTAKTGYRFYDDFDIAALKTTHSGTGAGSFKESGATSISASLGAERLDEKNLKITLRWTAY
jgi:hypothetical protein